MIQLENVIPEPLVGQINPQSGIWNTTVLFEKGKRYRISAKSGKGKSTLVSILYGLRSDYSGKVTWNNADISAFKPLKWAEIRQQQTGIVFQDLRLFLNRTVEENIAIKANLSAQNFMPEAKIMAEKLGISSLWNRSCHTLSYGERQRLAIIRALVQPFSVLMLDEPFSHLDDDNIKIASEILVTECNKRQAGFIITTLGHNYFMEYDQVIPL